MLRAKFQEITKCQLPNIANKTQNKGAIVFLFVRFLLLLFFKFWLHSVQLSPFQDAGMVLPDTGPPKVLILVISSMLVLGLGLGSISDIKNLFSADFWPVNMYHPIDIQMHLLLDFSFFSVWATN